MIQCSRTASHDLRLSARLSQPNRQSPPLPPTHGRSCHICHAISSLILIPSISQDMLELWRSGWGRGPPSQSTGYSSNLHRVQSQSRASSGVDAPPTHSLGPGGGIGYTWIGGQGRGIADLAPVGGRVPGGTRFRAIADYRPFIVHLPIGWGGSWDGAYEDEDVR